MIDRPIITDHALLRWLERCHGVDVEWFRARMEEEVAASLAARPKDQPEPTEACRFVVDDNRVITVLPPGMRLKKSKRVSGFHVPRVGAFVMPGCDGPDFDPSL